MIQFLSKKIQSAFFKNIATMVTGSGTAQLIPIITAPVLTRIYRPEDYGTLALYMSVSGVLSTLATFQYHQAILLAAEEEALRVLRLSIRLTFGLSVMLIILFSPISFWPGQPGLIWLLPVPLTVLFSGVNASFAAWANRIGAFKILSLNKILVALITPVISIGLGLIIPGPLGLFIGLMAGQFIPAFLLAYHLLKTKKISVTLTGTWEPEIFKKYKDFRKYVLPSEFINILVNQMPVLMLNAFGLRNAAGQFNLSNRILAIPSQVISGSIGEVFKQRAGDDYRKYNNCRNIFRKTFVSLCTISVPAFILVILLSPDAIPFVFGEKWIEAGAYTQTMGWLYMFQFIISPLSYTFYLAQKQKEDFLLHLITFIVVFSSFYVGYQILHSLNYALILYVISYGIIYIYYLIRSYYFSLNHEQVA